MSTIFTNLRGVVLDWHDGDTAHVNVQLPFGHGLYAYDIFGAPVFSCRLQGLNPLSGKYQAINAPELVTTEGPIALDNAVRLCPPGTTVGVISRGWDKFGGRWDGLLNVAGVGDLGAALVATGDGTVWATYSLKPTDTQLRKMKWLDHLGVRSHITLDGALVTTP